MDDALLMRALQRVRYLDGDLQQLLGRKRALLQPLVQGLALQVLHHQEVHARLVAHVVQRADVGVGQGGYRLGLAVEALPQSRVAGQVRGQDLDGDGALQASVAGAVHLTHAAGAGRGLDLVRS